MLLTLLPIIHLDSGIDKMAKTQVSVQITKHQIPEIGSPAFRGKSMRRSLSSHGRSVRILTYGGPMLFRLYVSHLVALTRQHGENGLLLLNYPIPTMHCCMIHEKSNSNLLAPSCPSLGRTWLMLLARSHMK